MPSCVLREITSFLICVESNYLRSTIKQSKRQSVTLMGWRSHLKGCRYEGLCIIITESIERCTAICKHVFISICTIQTLEGKWHVDSMSGSSPDGYDVTQILINCSECGQSNTVCTKQECGFLCYHMYKCASNCYDYNNGHICKHIHRVHSLRKCNSTSTTACGTASNEQPPSSEYSIDDFDTLSYAESVYVSQTGTGTFITETQSCLSH